MSEGAALVGWFVTHTHDIAMIAPDETRRGVESAVTFEVSLSCALGKLEITIQYPFRGTINGITHVNKTASITKPPNSTEDKATARPPAGTRSLFLSHLF